MKNKPMLLLKYLVLKHKYKKLSKEYQNLQKNFDFIFNENVILKGINKKRYVEQSKRMQFLIKRENKLQTIEQLATKVNGIGLVRLDSDILNLIAFIKEEL